MSLTPIENRGIKILPPSTNVTSSFARALSLQAGFSTSFASVSPIKRIYRPEIDGLRAIAVASVLLFHCGVPGFSGGYVGVDVFFVISGYLITSHLTQDAAEGRLSILRFYARRIRRILPALFVTALLTWAVAAILLLPSDLTRTSRALISTAASISNIYFWRSANYFDAKSSFEPLLHTWSLSVEEQFYAVIPLVMLTSGWLIRQRWWIIFLPICVASFALSVVMTTAGPTSNYYLLPTRAWELGIGSIVATVPMSAITRRWQADIAGLTGLLLVLIPVTTFDANTPFPGLNALYPCLGAAILLHAGQSANLVKAITSTRPFLSLGAVSYSLYLVHWPIIVFVHYKTLSPLTFMQVLMVIGLSLGLAILSWRFVEQPFRRHSPGLTLRRTLCAGLAAIAITAAVGWIGVRNHGFPTRFPDFAEQIVPGHETWKEGQCFLATNLDYHIWSSTECVRISTGQRKVLLWGDSFAAQYIPGLIAHADQLKITLIQYTAAGCPPVLSYYSYARKLCTAFNAHALDLIREQNIDTIIVSGRWSDLQQSRGLATMTSTLNALRVTGARVIVLGQSPEFVADVQIIGFLKGSRAPDAVNSAQVKFGADLNVELSRVIGSSATFIDPLGAFCLGLQCIYQDHRRYLFEDDGHMSAVGSDRAINFLLANGLLSRL